jgi:hypothetical protein
VLAGAVAALWLTSGGPNVAPVKQLFSGSRFDVGAGVALSELLLWCCLFAVAGYATIVIALDAVRTALRGRFGANVPAVLAVLGLAFLIVGLVRHATAGVSVCCGSVQEARDALGR